MQKRYKHCHDRCTLFMTRVQVTILAALSGSSAQADWLYSPEMLRTGDDPWDVRVADINADGHPEIITSNGHRFDPTSIGVLPGVSKGFGDLALYSLPGGDPFALALGRFDEDDIPDLVTARFGGSPMSGNLSVLFGDADAAFGDSLSINAPGVFEVEAADLNANGWSDLIYGGYSPLLSVALADRTGGFGAPSSYSIGVNYEMRFEDFAVTDLDADGMLDILAVHVGVTGTPVSAISVFYGRAGTTFSNVHSLTVGLNPSAVETGDLDQDGLPDIVVTNKSDDSVSILRNLGSGNFAAAQTVEVGDAPNDLKLADFNLDGDLDIVTANELSADSSFVLSDGAGGFHAATSVPSGFISTFRKLDVGRLNDDNVPDLVVTNNYASSSEWSSVAVVLSHADSVPRAHPRYATGTQPQDIQLADLNGDGLPDAAVVNAQSDTLSVFLGRGDGTFANATTYNSRRQPFGLAIADVDRNGIPDIVTANRSDDSVSVYSGNGSGGFASPVTYAVAGNPFDVAITDINHDGYADIVTAGMNITQSAVSVLFGRSSGGFAAVQAFNAGGFPSESVSAADINSDGFSDVILGVPGGLVNVLYGSASGLSAPQSFTAGVQPYSIDVGDVNGDGRLDLVAAGANTGHISVLLAEESGFADPVEFELSNLGDTHRILVADVTSDGHLDVLASTNAFGLAVFIGDGSGQFNQSRDFHTQSSRGALAVADLDNDGHPDLVMTDPDNSMIEVLLHQSGEPVMKAVSDLMTTTMNALLDSQNVLTNDIGSGIRLLDVSASSAQGGTVTRMDDLRLRYVPPNNFTGEDSFTYTITNAEGVDTSTATVFVTVTAATSGGGGNNNGGGNEVEPEDDAVEGGGGGAFPLPLLALTVFAGLLRSRRARRRMNKSPHHQ
jgi:hypothetical protein